MSNETRIWQSRLEQAREKAGRPAQWARVTEAFNNGSYRRKAQAEAAIRNAVMHGTDPSWYGF